MDWSVNGAGTKGRVEMLAGFITLYIELAGLIISGGYIVSSMFIPIVVPSSFSSEQVLLLSMQ